MWGASPPTSPLLLPYLLPQAPKSGSSTFFDLRFDVHEGLGMIAPCLFTAGDVQGGASGNSAFLFALLNQFIVAEIHLKEGKF